MPVGAEINTPITSRTNPPDPRIEIHAAMLPRKPNPKGEVHKN